MNLTEKISTSSQQEKTYKEAFDINRLVEKLVVLLERPIGNISKRIFSMAQAAASQFSKPGVWQSFRQALTMPHLAEPRAVMRLPPLMGGGREIHVLLISFVRGFI